MFRKICLFLVFLLISSTTYAWGRRGHETIASLAAQLLAKENSKGSFLMNHSYDLGYYANVPDFIWKAKPETYKKEHSEHYMDLEIFERDFKKQNSGENPWIAKRSEFVKLHPDIPRRAGGAFWRIQEFSDKLEKITAQLKDRRTSKDERRRLQAQWLLHAGIMGHYVGDLAQPLHVSEDYDGRKAGQAGLHSWFEDKLVDELYPTITAEVFQRAQKAWKDFEKNEKSKTAFVIALELGKNSQQQLPAFFKIDKTVGRKNKAKAAEAYKEMIIERQVAGILRLALIWSRHLGWDYDGHKFYTWFGEPDYIDADVDPLESPSSPKKEGL